MVNKLEVLKDMMTRVMDQHYAGYPCATYNLSTNTHIAN